MRAEMTYQCHLCNDYFTHPEKIKKHLDNIHSIKITPCGSCPSYFADLRELFLHARQVHNHDSRLKKKDCKLQCIVTNCDYRTNNGGLLKHHINSHLNVRPFVCPVCDKGFTQKTNMKTHYNRHKKSDYEFKCEPCSKSFNMHDSYLSHLETREHYFGEILTKKQVLLKCMLCKDMFANPHDVVEHTSTCSTTLYIDMPISCTICYKELPIDINELELHSREHREEIVCPHCDDTQTFNGIIAFNFHLTKKHNDHVIRRSACRYCEEVFANESVRNAHVDATHKDLRNRHKSRNETGRLLCAFENCEFSANSEIQAQKHFSTHYDDVDTDMFYKLPMDAHAINDEPTAQKKRGRPRLCDTPINNRNSNSDSSQYLSDSSCQKTCVMKLENRVNLNDGTNSVIPRRGRPKKMKEETIENLLPDFVREETVANAYGYDCKMEYQNSGYSFDTYFEEMDNKENMLQLFGSDGIIKEEEITILEV